MAYTCLISFGVEYLRKLFFNVYSRFPMLRPYHLIIPQASAGVAWSTAALQLVDGLSGREFRTVVRHIAEG